MKKYLAVVIGVLLLAMVAATPIEARMDKDMMMDKGMMMEKGMAETHSTMTMETMEMLKETMEILRDLNHKPSREDSERLDDMIKSIDQMLKEKKR